MCIDTQRELNNKYDTAGSNCTQVKKAEAV